MRRSFLALLATLAIPGGAMAQDADAGAAVYARHCATCHGLEGKGGGPMAPILLLQPTDLTQLSAKNGGAFPTTRVVMRIDGRDPLVAHGSPMPVYGDFFDTVQAVPLRAGTGQTIMASVPVADLVSYLESLQQ